MDRIDDREPTKPTQVTRTAMEYRVAIASGVVTVRHMSGVTIASTDAASASLPLASALCQYGNISDEEVAAVKEALAIDSSAKMQRDVIPEQNVLCKEVRDVLATLATQGHDLPTFPLPDGTRSAQTHVANIYNDERKRIGFVVFTSLWPEPTKNAVWVVC